MPIFRPSFRLIGPCRLSKSLQHSSCEVPWGHENCLGVQLTEEAPTSFGFRTYP